MGRDFTLSYWLISVNLCNSILVNLLYRKPLLLMCTTRKKVFVRTIGVGLGVCLTICQCVRKPLLLMCTTRKKVFVRTIGVGLGVCLTICQLF